MACARFPAVAEHLAWLNAQVSGQARMSGSGACVFAELSDRAAAEAVVARLPAGWRGWAAPGLAAHPLFDLAT